MLCSRLLQITTLVTLINPANPDELQHIFGCLSFLLKHLQKQLLRDIVVVFRSARLASD